MQEAKIDLIYNAHKTQEYFLWALSQDILEEKGVTAFAPGITSPNLNLAMQTGEIEGDWESRIQAVEKFYEGLHHSWAWVINPTRDQTNLKAALEKRGYFLTSNYPILVGSLDSTLPEDMLKNYDIKEVTEERLSDWILPLQEAFEATEVDALLYLETHLLALKKKANFHHFVAYVNGKPVSAATLSLSPYGAHFDDLGTKLAYRRKGFGRAMALYRMKIAQVLGYSWVSLEASDQGALLYRTLGFKELYRNEIYGRRST